MEGEAPIRRSEHDSPAVASAMTEVQTLVNKIVAELESIDMSDEPAVEVPDIGQKVSTAVQATMVHVDVTALRVQTLGSFPHSPIFRTRSLTNHTANIEFLYDLTTNLSVLAPRKRIFSAPKLVTTVKTVVGRQHFGASVVRIELQPDAGTVPDVTIEVCGCKSSIEAMQKLYEFSQDVLSNARTLSHDTLINARFDFWDDLESIHWGEGRHIGGGWC
jgi:hypothetical protein